MEPEPPDTTRMEARARRARAWILAVMAAFIVLPFVLWWLVGGGIKARP